MKSRLFEPYLKFIRRKISAESNFQTSNAIMERNSRGRK